MWKKEEERNTHLKWLFSFMGHFLGQMGSFIHNNCFFSSLYYVLCIATLYLHH